MVTKKAPRKTDRTGVIGAGATGGGVGSIVAALANTLPPDSATRGILTVAAPYIAVLISGLGLFIKVAYIDPFVNRRKNDAVKIMIEQALNYARAERERILKDPTATEEHKMEVVGMVQDLEKLQIRRISERLEVVLLD